MEVIDYGPDPATIRRRLAEAEAAIERLTAERDEARAEVERARRCGVEPSAEDARNIARAWSSHVWLSACDVGSDSDAPTNAELYDDAGAHTICDACDRGAGPTHSDLARARSAAFLAELERRGFEDGETIPADVLAMDEAPDGFNGWPDALSIEHDEDCPIRLLLEQAEALEEVRAQVERVRKSGAAVAVPASGLHTVRCADCDGPPVSAGEPVEHASTCPHVTVPPCVSDADVVAAAHEMARLFRHHATAPWWRALVRLVVTCEHPRADGPLALDEGDNVNALADLLSLVVDGVVVEGVAAKAVVDAIAEWTPEQRDDAEAWATAVHLDASDNHGIDVPPEPAHVLALRRALA